MHINEMMEVVTAGVAFAYAKLQSSLEKQGVRIITTNYAHGTQSEEVIDGTQKKGFIVDQDVSLISKAVDRLLEHVLDSTAKCEGANGYLLNYLNVEFDQSLARVVMRGCPTIAPDGFDFARASAELTAPSGVLRAEPPYGFDLCCHPTLVRPVQAEVDA